MSERTVGWKVCLSWERHLDIQDKKNSTLTAEIRLNFDIRVC